MKIYTRTGDDGSTGLIGGSRTSKDDPRIDCYGTIDELNAAVGLAASGAAAEIAELLRQVQNDLFVIGSHLASPQDHVAAAKNLPPVNEAIVQRLEMQIDAAEQELAPLRNFILPGGTACAAHLHLARTICRRGERLLVGFARERPLPPIIVTYMNRLSDWLFVHARLVNHRAGVSDVPWIP